MTCKDCQYRGVDSHNCPVCCCVGGLPDDCWKTIRPLTPYIGLDGKPVVCSDCEELRGMIAEHKASMMPSKCYPVGGRACRFIGKGV